MNIAFVTQALPRLPCRDGFRLYGANLIRCLSTRHRIDLISLLRDDDGQYLDWPARYCRLFSVIPTDTGGPLIRLASIVSTYAWGRPLRYRREVGKALRMGLQERNWDVLHIEGSYVGGLIPSHLPVGKVLSLHDSSVLRSEEMLQCVGSPRRKLYYRFLGFRESRYERCLLRRFERCVVVSERDAEAVRKTAERVRVVSIPNGIDTDFYSPQPAGNRAAALAFHGHLSYPPNVEAALTLANEIFPRVRRVVPDATLYLVGADPAPEIRTLASQPGIRLQVNLPDIRSALCSASVYVSPLKHGTGIKNKILEALALGLPVVCSAASVAGMNFVSGRHFLMAGDSEGFAAQILCLLRAPDRARRIAQAGREFVQENYSWECRSRCFEQLYQSIIRERNECRTLVETCK